LPRSPVPFLLTVFLLIAIGFYGAVMHWEALPIAAFMAVVIILFTLHEREGK